ncbi:MAG: cytochrome C554 [Deferribacteres bacterium]|nr:cytochrome C554 [candidate division KSB1 bacterium]MCB9500970.1 cytochrome C554 [Deferribacteres bacterium]
MKLFKLFLASVMILAFAIPAFAQDAAKFGYIGATKCKTCHQKDADGAQFSKWLDSKHSKAYETLASEEAKKIAKEKGIADPQKAKECIKCHVTGYDADASLLGPKYAVEEGVSCESCHGPGSEYKSKKTMKAISAGEIEPASVGLVKPDKKLCLGCHNDESPTFVSFNYEEAKEKIAHPVPKQ